MPSMEITDENFREVYQNNDIVVLDFWAVWCQPCHQFAPIFEEASEKHSDIVFGKIDTEANPKLSEYFGIRSIPTFMIIREGLEVFRHSGLASQEDIDGILPKVKAADMDEVRAKIEAEESK